MGALIEMIKEAITVEDVLENHLGVNLSNVNTSRKSFNVSCPLHEDRHPSFTVWTATNRWKCWAGCGSGDAINLVALGMGISNKHAIEMLSKGLGINKSNDLPPEYIHKAKKRQTERKVINNFNERYDESFYRLLAIEKTIKENIRNFKSKEEAEENHLLYHYLPYLSHLLDVLVEGDFEEQVDTVLAIEHLLEGEGYANE